MPGHHGSGTKGASRLSQSDRFYAHVDKAIVDWISLKDGNNVLDAGCGAGGVTSLLAAGVGESGQVTAFDIDEQTLVVAKNTLGQTEYHPRVVFQEADVSALPFPDDQFDFAWCSRMIHHIKDQVGGVKELCRVLKPGGKLFLREGGLRPRILPADIGLGIPGLEDRLSAHFSKWFSANVRPTSDSVAYHFGWTQMLRDSGFTDVSGKSFLVEFFSPFEEYQVDFVSQQLSIWLEDEERETLLSEDDRATLKMILSPESPYYAFMRADLHYCEVITVYQGRA
jgi:ubiquinone/menaquinone biosynthesis C-methylase UbiE